MAVPQEEKQFKNLAGEFGVASELCRRQMQASITFGSSKSADVFAINKGGDKIARIEVKTSSLQRWGVSTTETRAMVFKANVIWVFVFLPEGLHEKPRYFVLSSLEVAQKQKAGHAKYAKKYSEKHGRPPGAGFPSLSMSEVEEHEDRWEKVEALL